MDLDMLGSPAAFGARLCLPYLLPGQTFRLRLRGHGAYHIMAIAEDARVLGELPPVETVE